MKTSLYLLTCANLQEAQKIRLTLLQKKLIVCGKITLVDTANLWQGKIETSKEALLIMDSCSGYYQQIFTEVKKLHSYDTFVFLETPVTKTSSSVLSWLKKELS